MDKAIIEGREVKDRNGERSKYEDMKVNLNLNICMA